MGRDKRPHKTVTLELKEFKIGKSKGWAFDVTGNKNLIGVGISKDIYKNSFLEVDGGLYITKDVDNLFNMKKMPDLKFGLSGKLRLW